LPPDVEQALRTIDAFYAARGEAGSIPHRLGSTAS
jgi:hypothetical protein